VPVFRIDINRIDIAVLVSLLIHGMLAAIPIHQRPGERASAAAPSSFVATIVTAPAVRPDPVPAAVPEPVPVVRPRPIISPKPVTAAPPAKPAEPVIPVETVQPTPAPTPKFDMLAMINARRAQRQQAEQAMVQQEQARNATMPGSSDPTAAINRNLQGLSSSSDDGTGGVFQILSKGTRTGEFAFNGFRPDTQRRWREVIEVDAGPGGDIELAMVRRMIQLIRGHYTGNFTWQSHRLGKSIVMSARPEDGPELEEFLMREFFGTPTLAHRRPEPH
jgi:hypothetical protein